MCPWPGHGGGADAARCSAMSSLDGFGGFSASQTFRAMESASSYVVASCDGTLPHPSDIATACLVTCEARMTSIGDELFSLNPADETKLDATVKVKGVIVRLQM